MERAHLQKTIVLLVTLLSLSSASAAQRVTTLRSLSQLSPADLSTAIVRIDYLGNQNGTLLPVVFTIKGRKVDWNRVMMLQSLEDLSPKDLATAVVRIAYLGEQDETLPVGRQNGVRLKLNQIPRYK